MPRNQLLMPSPNRPIVIATRGSTLALAQTHMVLAECQGAFPKLTFEIKIIKTTGDKLQSVPPNAPAEAGSKGLFTKELEVALLNGEADFAVHSLKDLPTELPEGLTLGAVGKRADVRDVLIYRSTEFSGKRGLKAHARLNDFPVEATLATSSTRRQAQLQVLRPDLKLVPIRGNVGTRLRKLAEQPELDGVILAAAGLQRLKFRLLDNGELEGSEVPKGLLAVHLSTEEMLPCVGQAAIGIETRVNDACVAEICERLNHVETQQCVVAERSFLQGMGGGCMSPVAAYATVVNGQIVLRAASFRDGKSRTGEIRGRLDEAVSLGTRMAGELR